MKEQYSELAKAYDNLMYDVPYKEWAQYILRLIEKYGGVEKAPVEILECACGTGNITLELLRAGLEVVGVDIEHEMLNIAAGKLRKNAVSAQLVCADMVEFKLNKPVDAVVCACDGVNYVLTEERLQLFFANTYGNMKEKGIFLFDISSEYKLNEILGDNFYFDDADDQTVFWQNSIDKKRSAITMELVLFIKTGDCYTRQDERHVQHVWKIQEIVRMLEQAGFSDVKAYGFGTELPSMPEDERIQFVAIKE